MFNFSWISCYFGTEIDANQASTKHDDLLKYNAPTTRARTKKFKDALQVFMKSIQCETSKAKIQDENELYFIYLIQVQEGDMAMQLGDTAMPSLKQH